ncbi:response regulator [Sphaerotilus sp.]|uniref:response regulator n=1 Tax=Sphaerotilus sp. TaxID=2093942 RepID=UPI0034E26D39
MRVLLVEDNNVLAEWLIRALGKERYSIDRVGDGTAADLVLRSEIYDLVILDLSLPGLDGHEVLRRLRGRGDGTPVLVLTAHDSLGSRVRQLDSGADDVVGKPFELEELEARMRVLVRRSARMVNPVTTCGGLLFDSNSREISAHGVVLQMTPRERAVLELLMLKAGTTVPKQVLAHSLSTLDEAVSPDAVELYVHRVRKKIVGAGATIVTLRGLGYVLKPLDHGT